MSHENTITIEIDGKFFNIPTVVDGVQLSQVEAANRFDPRSSLHFGQFKNVEGALFSAGRRSELGHGSDVTNFTDTGSRISTKRVNFKRNRNRKNTGEFNANNEIGICKRCTFEK